MKRGKNYGMKKVVKNQRCKSFALCALAIILVSGLCSLMCACSSAPTQQQLADECVRIHIRANSNDDCDQQVKLLVRDKITAYLQTCLDDCRTKNDALNALSKEKENLVEIANSTLYRNGFTYKTTIALKNEYFPTREYDGYTFPEGNYDALIIYLGEGVGDNWWCVAFPPLCFVPSTSNGEKIVYKSWVKEVLDRLFS